jgi:hypothetical protein
MGCKVTAGITNACADLLKVSGLGKNFWVGYKSDLDTQISIAQTADISTLDFGSYGGLYKFEGSKFAHDYTYELAVASGGNKSWNQTFNAKVVSGSTTEDVQLQNLALGDDIFIIVETLNRTFLILGAANGLTANAGSGGSGGKEAGGDTADVLTLAGNEPTLPLRFALGGGYQATLDYITSRQV